jgi:peptide/nickel transport system substrate-binding protein
MIDHLPADVYGRAAEQHLSKIAVAARAATRLIKDRRSSMLTAVVASVCLALASCGGPASQSGPVRYATGGTFTMGLNFDPGAFDPYHSQLIFGQSELAYDSLVNLRADGTFVSGLADRWRAGTDSATFTLHPGVTCSDGTPLTAGQVAADLNYLGDPKNQSPLYGVTIPTVPYTAIGDDAARTVKVTMRRPFGFLLNTIGLTPIMCARGLKNPAMLKNASDGTGPFVLTSVTPGLSYTFTTRKDYTWGPSGATTKRPGTPAKVVLKVIPNETTMANLLLSGQLNLAGINGEDRRRLAANHLRTFEVPNPGAWLWFNQIGGRPTVDRRVRQALVSALDLSQLVKVSTSGYGTASAGLIALPPVPSHGDPLAGQLPAHNLAAAATLLDQAGWTKNANGTRARGGEPLMLDVHYSTVYLPAAQATAELMAQQWRMLGAQTKLTNDSAAALNKVLFQTSSYDVYVGGFGNDLPSQLIPYLSGPTPPNGTNLAGIRNRQYETLAAKAETLTPPAACGYWNQAEQALYHDVNPAPISNTTTAYFLHSAQAEVTGFDDPVPTSIRVLR